MFLLGNFQIAFRPLTTNIDVFTGGVADDVFIGDNGTAQMADQLIGGLGSNVLKLYATATLPTISGIQNVELYSMPVETSISFANNADVERVSLVNTTTDIDATHDQTIGLAGGTVLALNNVQAGDEDAGNVTVSYASSITSSTLVLNKAGNAATSGNALDIDIDGTGVTTLNISTVGAASRVVLDGTAEKIATLKITGDQNLTAKIFDTSATKLTITAATFEGDLNLDLSATEAYAVTGGLGDDRVLVAGTDDTFNGGAGVNTLASAVLDDGIDTLNANTNGVFKSANIQTFEYTGGGETAITLDASAILLPSVVNYEFSTKTFSFGTGTNSAAGSGAAGSSGVSGTAGGDALSISAQSNAQTFIFETNITAQNGGAGGSATAVASTAAAGGAGGDALVMSAAVDTIGNTLNLSLVGVKVQGGTGGAGGASAAAGTADSKGGAGGVGGDGLVATGFEFINIESTGTSSTAVNEFAGGATVAGGASGSASGAAGATGAAGDAITVSANTQFVITGANEMKLGYINSGNTAVGVDAGALTGKLTVSTGTAADVIIGGSSNNTLSLAGGADTINITQSVGKADVITTTGADNTTATNFVTIEGFTNSATTTVGDKLALLASTIHVNVAGGTSTGIANLTAGVLNGIMTFGGATSATATLAQKIEAAFSTNFASSTGEILAFQDSGNTYIVVNVDNTTGFDAGDQVIALEGLIDVTALSNSASAASTIWIV